MRRHPRHVHLRHVERPHHRGLLHRLATAALGLALVVSLGLTAAPSARAAVPQPGTVPWVNFAGPETESQVYLNVRYPEAHSGHWRTLVTVCNYTGSPLPVGPHAFSYTNFNFGTFFFTAGWTGSMANEHLANSTCATGYLMSDAEPMQMAFHKILTVNQRIDILPATEWEAILKMREPKSPGTTYVHGDYTGDSRADLNGTFGFNFYTFRTTTPGLTPAPFHQSSLIGPHVTWLSKVPDLDVNGASDLLMRTVDGKMHFQRMMDAGERGFSNVVGTGWNGITMMAVVPKSGPANQHPWLLARATNGNLIRYQVSPQGIYSAAVIGRHWNAISKIFSVGDFSGDGVPDLMAIGTNGLLYRYNMTPTGNISSVNVVGHGWATFLHAVSPGDMNGDGRWDMVGIRNDGKMFFYSNNSPGHWGYAREIDSGWAAIQSFG